MAFSQVQSPVKSRRLHCPAGLSCWILALSVAQAAPIHIRPHPPFFQVVVPHFPGGMAYVSARYFGATPKVTTAPWPCWISVKLRKSVDQLGCHVNGDFQHVLFTADPLKESNRQIPPISLKISWSVCALQEPVALRMPKASQNMYSTPQNW